MYIMYELCGTWHNHMVINIIQCSYNDKQSIDTYSCLCYCVYIYVPKMNTIYVFKVYVVKVYVVL